jgi:superfamily II DNA/RNA helicase
LVPFSQLERSSSIPSFLDLGVSASVAERLDTLGIADPLPIQAATLPDALGGHDVCGQAPTGSGKTLAYALPLIARTVQRARPGAPTGLVLVPTRELAQQVHAVLCSLYGPGQRRVAAIYGGTGYGPQRQALRRGVDIVVACPGRLEDLVAQGDLRLDEVGLVVLDEADRMVDMGFLRPVRRLMDQTADTRQVLLFSATMGREVEAISREYQHAPRRCVIAAEAADIDAVTHLFWRAERLERVGITAKLIDQHGQAFVFCRTKRGADRVTRQLRAAGVAAAAIHGDRSQAQRARALASFAVGDTHALVATDVVARGIHVDDVPCVVHFDPPDDPNSYVHRSGRTGRTGRAGTVVSLVADEHRAEVRSLQQALGLRPGLGDPFDEEGGHGSPRIEDPDPTSSGARPAFKRPSGQRSTGQRPTGQRTAGQRSTGHAARRPGGSSRPRSAASHRGR